MVILASNKYAIFCMLQGVRNIENARISIVLDFPSIKHLNLRLSAVLFGTFCTDSEHTYD